MHRLEEKRRGSAPAASASTSSTSVPAAATPQTKTKTPTAADKEAAEKLKTAGNQLMARKAYSEAIAKYTAAIDLDPTSPVFYSNRAAAYSQVGNHGEAINDARKAAEVDPTFSKAYSRLGCAEPAGGLDIGEDARTDTLSSPRVSTETPSKPTKRASNSIPRIRACATRLRPLVLELPRVMTMRTLMRSLRRLLVLEAAAVVVLISLRCWAVSVVEVVECRTWPRSCRTQCVLFCRAHATCSLVAQAMMQMCVSQPGYLFIPC